MNLTEADPVYQGLAMLLWGLFCLFWLAVAMGAIL